MSRPSVHWKRERSMYPSDSFPHTSRLCMHEYERVPIDLHDVVSEKVKTTNWEALSSGLRLWDAVTRCYQIQLYEDAGSLQRTEYCSSGWNRKYSQRILNVAQKVSILIIFHRRNRLLSIEVITFPICQLIKRIGARNKILFGEFCTWKTWVFQY